MNKTMSTLFALICFSTFVAQTNAKDEDSQQSPPVDPPQILVAAGIDDDDQLVLVSYHSIFIGFEGDSYNERLLKEVSLEEVTILQNDGTELSIAQAREKLANGDTPIVVTSYKQPVPEFYAKLFKAETLQFVFPSRAPEWRKIESPGARVRG